MRKSAQLLTALMHMPAVAPKALNLIRGRPDGASAVRSPGKVQTRDYQNDRNNSDQRGEPGFTFSRCSGQKRVLASEWTSVAKP